MCGTSLLFNSEKQIDQKTVEHSLEAMKHRGPDASGVAIECNGQVGIGNNRLSFVDVDKRSNQPLVVGNYVISFNGEIYNYLDLKGQLEKHGYFFTTTSDTEVIVHSFDKWGENALLKFNGCFAFIIYNRKTKKIFVARDRLGEKQLVYTKAGNGDYMFASECKGLFVHPYIHIKPNLDRYLSELMFNLYADQEETFFEGVYNMPPGHFLAYDMKCGGDLRFIRYWDVSDISIKPYTKRNLPTLIESAKDLLTNAVHIQVPKTTSIGSVLSGGLDSSFITAIYADRIKPLALDCFTIGYEGAINRDLKNARVLRDSRSNIHLHERIINAPASITQIANLTMVLEEPVADSILPSMFENYKAAKQLKLRCVFNGQGADEQWLGYLYVDPIFGQTAKTYRRRSFAKYWYDSSYFIEHITHPLMKKRIKDIIEHNLEKNFHSYQDKNYLEVLTRFAIRTHLAGLLRHEDRLSMANSIEVRLPYLDKRLIEFALSIPANLKIYDGREKYILRNASRRIIPNTIAKRRKQGFPHAPNYNKNKLKIMYMSELKESEVLRTIFKSTLHKISNLPQNELQILYALTFLERLTRIE